MLPVIILTFPEGAVICHWQRALFGYVDSAYPGDWMVPETHGDWMVPVNSTGSEPQASVPVFKTIDGTIAHAIKCVVGQTNHTK